MEELAAQAERFDPVALTQDIAILEELRRNVRQSQAGRALLDATLVRLALADSSRRSASCWDAWKGMDQVHRHDPRPLHDPRLPPRKKKTLSRAIGRKRSSISSLSRYTGHRP